MNRLKASGSQPYTRSRRTQEKTKSITADRQLRKVRGRSTPLATRTSRPRRTATRPDCLSLTEEEEVKKALRASISSARPRVARRERTRRCGVATPARVGRQRSFPVQSELGDDADIPCTEDFIDYLCTRNTVGFNVKLSRFDRLIRQLQASSSQTSSDDQRSNATVSLLTKNKLARARQALNAAKSYVTAKKRKGKLNGQK